MKDFKKEELKEEVIKVECPVCKGTGLKSVDNKCEACSGTGEKGK